MPANEKRNHSVSVLLTPDEFERLEAYCSERGYKKSTLIARLIRAHLDGENFRVASDRRKTRR